MSYDARTKTHTMQNFDCVWLTLCFCMNLKLCSSSASCEHRRAVPLLATLRAPMVASNQRACNAASWVFWPRALNTRVVESKQKSFTQATTKPPTSSQNGDPRQADLWSKPYKGECLWPPAHPFFPACPTLDLTLLSAATATAHCSLLLFATTLLSAATARNSAVTGLLLLQQLLSATARVHSAARCNHTLLSSAFCNRTLLLSATARWECNHTLRSAALCNRTLGLQPHAALCCSLQPSAALCNHTRAALCNRTRALCCSLQQHACSLLLSATARVHSAALCNRTRALCCALQQHACTLLLSATTCVLLSATARCSLLLSATARWTATARSRCSLLRLQPHAALCCSLQPHAALCCDCNHTLHSAALCTRTRALCCSLQQHAALSNRTLELVSLA
jgi:hypothetical protein